MPPERTIIVRCDADPIIGMGHLTRCCTLASELVKLGFSCILAGPHPDYRKEVDSIIFSDWTHLPWKNAGDDAKSLTSLASEYLSECIILDDYRVEDVYQKTLFNSGISWLQFDGDRKNKLWADLVLNPTPGIFPCDYYGLLQNPTTKLLLGPRYAILRKEFAIDCAVSKKVNSTQVTLMFGGGDDRGSILFVLRTLLPMTDKSVRFLVISGSRNPHSDEIADWIDAYGEGVVTMVKDPLSVAEHLRKSALAILSPGMSAYEAASCRVPIIFIALTDRQTRHAVDWARAGLADFVGTVDTVNIRELQNRLKILYLQHSKRHGLVAGLNKRIVDGLGRVRVAREIAQLMHKSTEA